MTDESNNGDPFAQVREFWEIGHTEKLADHPKLVDGENLQLCLRLIREEHTELLDAVTQLDLVETADALGDLIYVTIGMALACGIPMGKVFDEIHRSNMAKFPGGVVTRRESDGKVLKPEGWQPPNIRAILNFATGTCHRIGCGKPAHPWRYCSSECNLGGHGRREEGTGEG